MFRFAVTNKLFLPLFNYCGRLCSISADVTGVNSKWDLLTFPRTVSFKQKRSSLQFLVVGTGTDDGLGAALVKDAFVYTACKLAGQGLKSFLKSYSHCYRAGECDHAVMAHSRTSV